jgi:hypothetical protein
MLSQQQRKTLYNQSRNEIDRWSHTRSQSTFWINNVRSQWLYQLACEVAGVESMFDDQILPTFFGKEGTRLIESVVRSEHYFWKIAHRAAELLGRFGDFEATEQAVWQVRNDNLAAHIDRMAALENRMTHEQISQFTAFGVILWDEGTGNWIPNPLWFKSEELAFKPLKDGF